MNQKESANTPTKTYMSEQEFTAHMNGLIPTPSAEANSHLDLSAPVIKCKKTPRKKCRFMAEEAKKR